MTPGKLSLSLPEVIFGQYSIICRTSSALVLFLFHIDSAIRLAVVVAQSSLIFALLSYMAFALYPLFHCAVQRDSGARYTEGKDRRSDLSARIGAAGAARRVFKLRVLKLTLSLITIIAYTDDFCKGFVKVVVSV